MEIVDRVLFREISWILVAKLCALVVIYFVFFSNPVGAHMTDVQVGSAVFGPAGH